ncbi:MAG: GntR family transcriptional regulator, partial [Oscillospiraceae bacterium]
MEQELIMTGINKKIPVALYYQLKESIYKKIISQEWKPGSKIPTESAICAACGVSRITVRKALEELQNEGYLRKVQGRGTFIEKKAIEQKLSKFYSFSEELKQKGLQEHAELISFACIPAENGLEKHLNLEPGTFVYCIERVRYIGDEAYAIEKSYIPQEYAQALNGEMVRENGLYKSLNSCGIFLNSATEQFSAKCLN